MQTLAIAADLAQSLPMYGAMTTCGTLPRSIAGVSADLWDTAAPTVLQYAAARPLHSPPPYVLEDLRRRAWGMPLSLLLLTGLILWFSCEVICWLGGMKSLTVSLK
jgi:hypothetical protein